MVRGRNNIIIEEKRCYIEIECLIFWDVLIGKGNENIICWYFEFLKISF